MESGKQPENRLNFSPVHFKALVDYVYLLDAWRDIPAGDLNGQILKHYLMLDRFFYDRPAVRLSSAGLALGASTQTDAQAFIIQKLRIENQLNGEDLNSVNNLSQQINFMRSRYHGNDAEFSRFLVNHHDKLLDYSNQSPELYLTALSIFWSASRSLGLRKDITHTIGTHFRA